MSIASPTNPPTEAPRRRWWRRWFVRLPIVLLVFVIVLIVFAQIVLWSDWPRQIAEREIGKALGVSARVESVDISWSGRTRVRGLSLTLPMAADPIVSVRTVEIDHTALPLLMWRQNVQAIAADGVTINAREESAGLWNLQQFLDGRPQKTRSTDETRGPTIPSDIPELVATNVTIAVRRADGSTGTLDGMELRLLQGDAGPIDRVIVAGTANDDVRVNGKLGLVNDLPHELHVRVDRIPAGINALLGANPPAVVLDATWSGRISTSNEGRTGFTGVLSIARASAAGAAAMGLVAVRTTKEGAIVAAPRGLDVESGPRSFRLVSGEARIEPDSKVVWLDRIRGVARLAPSEADSESATRPAANGEQGVVTIDANFNLDTFVGDASLAWTKLQKGGVESSGTATLSVARQLAGDLHASIVASASAAAAAGSGRGTVRVDLAGRSIENARAKIKSESLEWTPAAAPGEAPQTIAFPALVGEVEARGAIVSLVSLRPVDENVGDLVAAATLDRSRNFWWASLDARGVRLRQLGAQGSAAVAEVPIDLNLDVYGSKTRLEVKQAYARADTARTWASGFYDSAQPEPLRLDTWVWLDAPQPTTGPASAEEDEDAQIAGLFAHGVVAGTLEPMRLGAKGVVRARDLTLRGRRIGDVDIEVDAVHTLDGGSVHSREIELLGGQWTLRGAWPSLVKRGAVTPTIVLAWRNLPLERVGELLGVHPDEIDGVLDSGEAVVTFPPAGMEVRATASGSKLRFAAANADTLKLTATLAGDGSLVAEPVLTLENGTIESKITTDISKRRRRSAVVSLVSKIQNWPAVAPQPSDPATAPTTEPTTRPRLADLRSILSGDVALKFAPHMRELSGDANVSGSVTARVDGGTEDIKVGDARFVVRIDNSLVKLSDVAITSLGGTATAAGEIDLKAPNRTRFDMKLNNLAATEMAWLVPQLADAAGRYSGELKIQPSGSGGASTFDRPLGPLDITFNLESTGGNYRGIALSSVTVGAFADITSMQEFRIVTKSADVAMADGHVRPFVRLSRAPGRGLTQLVTAELSGLDLEPIVRAFHDDGKPIVGRVSGEVRMFGSATALDRLAAEADVRLTQSDLANFGPVAALYDVMRIGTSGEEPRGEGDVSVRVEGATLTINRATYFNRGVSIEAFGMVKELNRLPESPIDLTLVGSAQPLRDIELPLFADADKLFEVLQTSLVSIRAQGTMKEPVTKQVSLSELGDDVIGVITGKVKE